MARIIKKSIYGEKIKSVNCSDILWRMVDESRQYGWSFEVSEITLAEKIKEDLTKLDFEDISYGFKSKTYWCGILTAEPFGSLMNDYTEEDVLNLIKDNNLKLAVTKEGLVIEFHNPTSSPLYRFFNNHKEDGYGGNVPYSVDVLISRIEKYLKECIAKDFERYGEWTELEEYCEELA